MGYPHPQLTLEDAGTPVNTPNKQQEMELKHTSGLLDYSPQGEGKKGRRTCEREKKTNRGGHITFSLGEMEDIKKAKNQRRGKRKKTRETLPRSFFKACGSHPTSRSCNRADEASGPTALSWGSTQLDCAALAVASITLWLEQSKFAVDVTKRK